MGVINLIPKNPEGCILTRDKNTYLVVKSDRRTFTGKFAYGLVDLYTNSYAPLDVSFESLSDILEKGRLQLTARNLPEYYRLINGVE